MERYVFMVVVFVTYKTANIGEKLGDGEIGKNNSHCILKYSYILFFLIAFGLK